MDIFRNHRAVMPVLLASLILPLGLNAEAAYAADYSYRTVSSYEYSVAHGQSITTAPDTIMPQIVRDTVTVIDPPSRNYEGKNIGSVNGDIIATAKQYIGTPYIANAADPNVGFDCSGFVMYVFAQIGMHLPHNANVQGQIGTRVPMSEAIPGDLLVWEGHVAIYVGNGMMIDSAKPGTTVNIRPIWGEPYVSRLT